ncbi:hypothetical protein IKG24_01840 [Candidatus Saccharibacteria bacterium]|nr:hypothetical protein [Candidatus Saccharibacteria bacterium]
MVKSSLNVERELKKIREDYAMALEDSGRLGISVKSLMTDQELRDMQTTLHSIIINLENTDNPKEVERSNEAAVLYNAISAILNSSTY